MRQWWSRGGRVARTIALVIPAIVLAACDSLVADIPRIGYELAETFGHPPLVHREQGNSLEVIFPEDLVDSVDAQARVALAWRIAQESTAMISQPSRVPHVTVVFRERQLRRQLTDPREERFTWSTASVGAGDSAAVWREVREGGGTGNGRRN